MPKSVGRGTPEAQELLVETWRFRERHGFKPSIVATIRWARERGDQAFDDKWARTLLRPFAANCTQVAPSGAKVHPGKREAAPRSEVGAPSSNLGTRAHDKVLQSNPKETTSPDAEAPVAPEQQTLIGDAPPAKKAGRRREPSEADLAAWAILAAAWPLVADYRAPSMSDVEWKKQNKASALDLHRIGRSPDDVAAMLRVAYTNPKTTPYLRSITRLTHLAERWSDVAALAPVEEFEHGWVDGKPVSRKRGTFLPGFTTFAPEREIA
jgi:hypothetical protein